MKKIALIIFGLLLSLSSYGQLDLEGFESPWTGTPPAPPGGWVVLNEVGLVTWVQSTAGNTTQQPVYAGNHAAFLDKEDVIPGSAIPSNWLITKQFNSPVNGQLHFYSRLTQLGDQGGIYKTMIALVPNSTTPVENLTWVDLQTWTELTLNQTQNAYAEKTVIIPAVYTNQQIRIAFIMQGDNKDRWLIDNVEVVTKCAAPTTLKATDITLSTANLSWTNIVPVDSWEIEVLPQNVNPTFVGITYSGVLPYLKSGLTENTDYKYFVRAKCTGGGSSEWVGPFYFSTISAGENCSAPIIIPALPGLPYTTNNTTANFSDVFEGVPGFGCTSSGNYLAGNDVVYSYTPATNGTIQVSLSNTGGPTGVFVYSSCTNIGVNCINGAVASATTTAVIPTLVVTAGTTYYFVISTNGTPQVTPYTFTLQQVYCTAPTTLTANNITEATANLSWGAGTASSWELAVQDAGTGIPVGNGLTVNTNTGYTATKTVSNILLNPSTGYEYYVRANCNDGTFSTWAGPFNFTTTQVPAPMNYSENFDGSSNGWSLNNGTQVNKWVIGAATSSSPSKSLYLSSDNGLTNNYDLSKTTVVHAYRDIQMPQTLGNARVSFDLKVGGENTDYVRVWLVPASFVPTPGTPITATNSGGLQLGGDFYVVPTWTPQNIIVNASTFGGSIRRLVFEWTSDNSLGAIPGAAIDNISMSVDACPAPIALTFGTPTTSVNLNWTAPTGTPPTGYEYYFTDNYTAHPTAGTTPSGTSATTSAILTPLTPSVTYYAWVRSTCGPTDKSYWAGPVTITSPQVPATITYTENFDTGDSNFSFVNGAQYNKWTIGSAVSNSSSKSLYISENNGATNTYNITAGSTVHAYRDVTIPATANEIRVSFDYKTAGESSDYFRVWMVPVNFIPTAGTQISSGANRVQLGANFTTTNTWTTASYDTPVAAYQNQPRRLIFEWVNNGYNGISPPAAIDNINISVVTCPKPTTLTAINITNTVATLDWTEVGTASNWEVAILPVTGTTNPPAPTGSGTPVTTDSSYTTTSGSLLNGTQYVYYVRSNCGGANNFSKWEGPFKFALKPLNDECAQAIVVPTNPDLVCTQSINGTVIGASGSLDTTTCAGGKDDDVWYEFVAVHTSQIITFSTVTGTTTDLYHAVYSGNQCGTMTQMYCSDPNSSLATGLVVGQTYKIRVWTTTTTTGQNTKFKLCVTTPPLPPVNDECANAVNLTVNPTLVCTQTKSGTLFSATQSSQTSTCTGTSDDDVWYSFVATNAIQKISFTNIAGSVTDLVHVLYSGTDCNTLTQLYCSDPDESWAENLIVGQTYKIRVYTKTAVIGQTTTFNVCIATPPPAPVNNDCAAAITVPVNTTMTCNQTIAGTIEAATASTEANTCTGTADDDVWYQFTATSTIHAIDIKEVQGSVIDLVHVLYSGNQCGTMTQLYCSDADYSLATGLVIGQVYKIRVYTKSATTHQNTTFKMCVTTPVPPATNDNCANAIIAPVNNNASCDLSASGNLYGATASPEPNTCAGNADDDVWFEFVATNTTHLISLMNISGSTANLNHVLYSGNQCGLLVQLLCGTTNTTATNLVVGNTYKIRVYSTAATPQTSTFDLCIRIPNSPIAVNTTQYTTEQLVRDVLINSPCALVSNITSRSAADYGDAPSLASFDANGSTFPFDYGVVLSTGSAVGAQGPFNFNDSTDSEDWIGDNDLEDIIIADDPDKTDGTHNATVLEFDFVPLTNNFKFNFLFASNEYGTWQCSYTDAFAFILTDSNGVSKNLAVLPNTNIPVGVGTIRNSIYNTDCDSANVSYFGQNNQQTPILSAISMIGQTKPLTASANVIPGESYHIKLVIADYSDIGFSSAVFLDGGSFDIGSLDLGADLLVSTGTALCNSSSAIIDTQLVGANYIFTWYQDGVVIPGATSSSYEVTESGNYGVTATFANVSCSYEGNVIVEIYPLVEDMTGDPVNITTCDASGFTTFDLTSNVNAILTGTTNPLEFTSTIHQTEADAKNGNNPIADITAYTNIIPALETLWIRTVYSVNGCIGIKPFDLIIQDLTPHFTIDTDFSICAGTSNTIDIVAADYDPATVTYSWTHDSNPLPDNTSSITVNQAGAYVVIVNNSGCTNTATVNVVVTPIPVADVVADVTACESYILPALSAGNNYYDANNQLIAAGQEIFQTQTIEVRASSGTTPNCTASNTFILTIVPRPVVTAITNVEACDSYKLPAIAGEGNYFTGPDGTGTKLNADDVITTSQIIYVYAVSTTPVTLACAAETNFTVTITTTPVVDAPIDVRACDSYKLPALTSGNYFTGPNGTGTPLFADQDITQTTTLYVFAKNSNCTDENSFEVRITPTPVFSLGSEQKVCVASNAVISVTPTNFNVIDATYSWTLEGNAISGNNSIIGSGFGKYEVTVTIGNCFHTESVVILENKDGIALIINNGCEDNMYMVGVTDDQGSFNIDTATYAWTGPQGFASTEREFAAINSGTYTVTVTTPDGCIGQKSVDVTDTNCNIQRGISPNGDGLNDNFDLTTLNVRKISIFNRYGQEVYTKGNYKNEWYGQDNNGDELPTGTYFYSIELLNGNPTTGWIYINRQE